MRIRLNSLYLLVFFAVLGIVSGCTTSSDKPKEIPLAIQEDSVLGRTKAEDARKGIAAKVADGLELTLWASDSLAPDPIAMQIDDQGNVYLTRTNRQKNSEFDIRGYQHWMTPSISLQTVEDRRNFLRETFAPEKSEENEWFPDLNNDSIHDWKDLTVEKEEVWKLEDTDGDGLADVSTRILEDFNDEITDVAGALLVRNEDIFVGVGPDMWRLWDTNDDGVLDEKTSIAHGFAVHIGFGAHGMSGAVEGPDGKIYWGIGDIGASITTIDGEKHHYPNQGMIVRCNPDGSDFEVFARGLRNTHEFVFDTYGNIISSDNDGDHAGESERLVHIVEGSDAGWRSNWQYGKYTDPKNNDYKVWMDEKLYLPRWEGQAAYIIPPIMNYYNGPTGMAFNPGTALGTDWLNKFFLVEFVGDPGRSHIWSFGLKPKGASFELDGETDVLSGVLPTAIQFGPDGALYAADWINGWGTKNYGRIWKLDVTPDKNDLEKERAETQRLMTLDYEDQDTDELVTLLRYPDMRIRKKAQFELATRTFWGYRALKKVLKEETDQLARVHAIWGIGQIAASDPDDAKPLLELLSDEDPEIIAQAAKVLGDVRYRLAGTHLEPLLQSEHPRVQFFAAQALGRIGHEEAVDSLLALLESNKDEDVYIRHAAVLALSRIGKVEPILALADHPNRSLRLGAVLVLRRLRHEGVAQFLNDMDEYIVTEAARAINDDWSIEPALPALAKLLVKEGLTSEPLLRRAINAALRVGGDEHLNNLLIFAKRNDIDPKLRGEALAALGGWANPSVLDRVTGRYRGEIKRDSAVIKGKIEKGIPKFLEDTNPDILVGVSKTLASLGIDTYNDELVRMMKRHQNPDVRAAMLDALGRLGYDDMETALNWGMGDKAQQVRETAVGLLDKMEISKERLPELVNSFFRNGTSREQQRLLGVLGEMPLEKSEAVLGNLIQKAQRNQLSPDVTLDLMEAVEASESNKLIAQMEVLKGKGHSVDSYRETLYGGSWWPGYSVFTSNPTAQCVRCHAVGGAGGQVGPPLDNIGNILSREQILESLIEPSARLAPGYGNVTLTLKDGQEVTGILEEENQEALLIRTSDAEPMEIALSRIHKRTNAPSSMPAMGRLISKRELRNLIHYLASLKKEPSS
ncbi:c-type cytochrome [Flavobacteriaceae bacterium TP-CH-4]|uniref:C-type cytochrome n=1 Tax=Pelagihabitans pacificus TaxID=2696054 RepID=A0A967E922_9FLAO|nr:HEAT repeat domain-containing protein [Pelagihabitans pacificus]NHF58051.1 c-type cytochrome [Pelagihabitans pacificus]